MKSKITVLSLIIALSLLTSCGVDESSSSMEIKNAPNMAGDWNLLFLPTGGTCPSMAKGLAVNSPIQINGVKQNGNNLHGSFMAGADSYLLSGNIINGRMILAFDSIGTFVFSAASKAKRPVFTGVYNGNELPTGCDESGIFIGSTQPFVYPAVAGLWTLTLTGDATDCANPLDEGAFNKVIPGIVAASPVSGSVAATYFDPLITVNVISGVAVSSLFGATISDAAIPPTRVAILDGNIDETNTIIEGTLGGDLVFANGICAVDGTFTIDY